ncbi:unnamed protein product [Caenorhabditis auriculariae]|uniref:Protein kinase domain-containing protein n=1 Tax=Caenorhabditis auriculariae TaxID=2777116 RepID=A0A8S1HI54_9PELO|nr:unnamed protein product [Caenorhabditis auriculariae]
MDGYRLEKVAGRGAFGVVLVARCVSTKKRVAIKRMLLESADRLAVARELSALRCLQHPNVLKYLDVFAAGGTLSIVTEEVPYTLHDVIVDVKRPKTDQFLRWFYSQLLEGVSYMHSKGVMHRDMKPENVLVTSQNLVKIADFGQACLYVGNDPKREYDENVATRWYRAPELLFSYRKYTPTVDVWAIGCILGEFLRRKPIFGGRSDLDQISLIFGVLGTPTDQSWRSWNKMPDAGKLIFASRPAAKDSDWFHLLNSEDVTPGYLSFLKAHLQLCGDSRPTASELKRHPWLTPASDPPQYRPKRQTRSRSHDAGQRRQPRHGSVDDDDDLDDVAVAMRHRWPSANSWAALAAALTLLLPPGDAIKCYCTDDKCIPYGSCDGDVCMVGILRESNQVIRTCGTSQLGCHRNEEDKWTDLCACDQPFCNTFAYLRSHTRRRSSSYEWSAETSSSQRDRDVPAAPPPASLGEHDAPLVFHRMDRPDDQTGPPPAPISTKTSLLTLLLVVVPLTVGAATVLVVAFNYYCHLC